MREEWNSRENDWNCLQSRRWRRRATKPPPRWLSFRTTTTWRTACTHSRFSRWRALGGRWGGSTSTRWRCTLKAWWGRPWRNYPWVPRFYREIIRKFLVFMKKLKKELFMSFGINTFSIECTFFIKIIYVSYNLFINIFQFQTDLVF